MFNAQSRQAFFPSFPPEVLDQMPSRLAAWADRQRQRTALARLDDRLLKDVGVSRKEADVESHRWD